MIAARLLALAALLVMAPAMAREPMGKVALTFDDLPALTVLPDQP